MTNTHALLHPFLRALLRRADRHAESAMLFLSGLVMAFFITFLFVFAQAIDARAQEACHGVDLIEKWGREDPDRLAALQAEAATELNGKAVFFRIEKEGVPASYLLGTMHMADARIARLDGERLEAFEKASTVIVENVEALDPARAQQAMLEHKDMTLYTDGTTLADRLPEDVLEKLKLAAEKRGIPFAVAQIMQPWLVATMVALPACELAEKRSGKPVLDALIVDRAKSEGKALKGLETIAEQFTAMASLPEAFHLKALEETLAMGNLAEDVMETMKRLYLAGEIGMVFPLTKAVSPMTSQSSEFEGFKDSLITKRNALMAERALPLLAEGRTFMAVGALHLPGESGLVEAFRAAGYTVSAIE